VYRAFARSQLHLTIEGYNVRPMSELLDWEVRVRRVPTTCRRLESPARTRLGRRLRSRYMWLTTARLGRSLTCLRYSGLTCRRCLWCLGVATAIQGIRRGICLRTGLEL
jgi:hypothetical protein